MTEIGRRHWMFANARALLGAYRPKELLIRLAEEYLWWLVRGLPGMEGAFLRFLFLKATTKQLDGFCWIGPGCTIVHAYNLSIGKNFTVTRNALIEAYGGITLGDGCSLGPNVVVMSRDHNTLARHGYTSTTASVVRPVTLGHGVWVGANSFVRAGVSIGDDAVVAPCSAVLANVPARAHVVGAPAVSMLEVARRSRAAAKPASE
jgi:acetyltransferase-like isoleucine patch superfamily enzyme